MFRRLIQKAAENYRERERKLGEKGLMQYLFSDKGYVLIIVLLVTTMLVSVSTEFLINAQTNINYIKKFSEKLRAYTIAKSGIKLSTFILEADKRGVSTGLLTQKVDKNIDCYMDLWAIDFPELPFEEGNLKIAISDENAKINMSVLANEFVDQSKYYGITQRLFINMGFPQDYADAIIDWVDIDDSRFPYGAESSDYYLSLERPYRAKNLEMDSIDEMLMIKGITPEIYYGLGGGNFGKETNLVKDNRGAKKFDLSKVSDVDTAKTGLSDFKTLEVKIGKEESRRLSDYFRVNGERKDVNSDLNKININTASYRVLSALTDSMSDDIVTEIIRLRTAQPFSSVNEVKDFIQDETIRSTVLSVKSYIFKIESTGRVNNTTVKITGIYYRDEKKFYYWSEE